VAAAGWARRSGAKAAKSATHAAMAKSCFNLSISSGQELNYLNKVKEGSARPSIRLTRDWVCDD
jgi:hypothetical protein